MMNQNQFNDSLFSFIKTSPTPFHAAAEMREIFIRHDFIQLPEDAPWNLEPGNRYVITRNGAIIAFTLGASCSVTDGFRIIGTHTDSPALQLKPHFQSTIPSYRVAGVEKYGGAILHTWLDRPLSLAGRAACLLADGRTVSLLVDYKEPIAYIPNLAIHFNREINDNFKVNAQTDLSPVLGQGDPAEHDSMLMTQLKTQYPEFEVNSIYGFDLYCYDPADPDYVGLNREFIAAPRLDNLASCCIGLTSLLGAGSHSNCMLVCTNHEEVGSTSNSGASGNMAESIFARICADPERQAVCLHNSFFLSLDNAHATHPNHKDKSDQDHPVILNDGPVVKLNANQRYSSNSTSAGIFRLLAAEANVPVQEFVMRSDMVCGSTIGPMSSASLGTISVDVGIPTWGMHSIKEITGAGDPFMLFMVVSHYLKRKSLPNFQ
jgi:aspartyl aminopeptidase